MTVGVVLTRNRDVARRAAPLATAAGALGGAAFLATHDPSGSGVRYPACVFHRATGLWCPGCGLTRGCYELLHGHVVAALSYNVFTPLAVVALVAGGWAWLRWAWRRPWRPRINAAAQQRLLIWVPVVLAVYAVARNIPAAPFDALAP